MNLKGTNIHPDFENLVSDLADKAFRILNASQGFGTIYLIYKSEGVPDVDVMLDEIPLGYLRDISFKGNLTRDQMRQTLYAALRKLPVYDVTS